ncbi:HTH-type transcriptional activator IlvY [Granulosicoccus antarcticus]|uniref:HTH-type transcriptional regulator GltC n=1 Tax=Granulosicoccus antarcticus IMCC3135 TaxID=1192854 RepID=A0A2Z2NV81_9GAMM|nr:HTH-type transcriptional activator IlvY [Granulosicoccus antarcticus]ASJ72700.1 HTH-type transcriptional regulator GltC [Granulosicoccus antarcticus IMCC3135]
MNPRTLNQFLALTRTLHFGHASEACNISLSTLSRNIRQLEEELGVSLFERDNRSVVLSAKGLKFEIYARETLTNWNRIQRELLDTGDPLHGELSIYCSVTASQSILYDLLNRFRPNYPGIDIKLHTGDPEHAIPRALTGEEDISIAAYPGRLSRSLIFKPAIVSPLLFIAPAEQIDSDIPIKPPMNTSEWSRVPMIVSEGGILRTRTDSWFKAMHVTPRIYAQVAGNEAIVSMVSLGLGVGVVPKIVLDNSPMAERIRILQVKPELEAYDVGLFTLKKSLQNPLVAAFWGVL